MRRVWLWVAAGALLVGVVGGAWLLVTSARKAPERRAQIKVPEESAAEKERNKLERMVSSGLAAEELKLDKAEQTAAGWALRLTAEAKDAKLTAVLEQARKVFQEVQRTGVNVATVSLLTRTDALRDLFGKELKGEPVVSIELSGETLDRVEWRGFDPRHFSRVAAKFWLHDELRPQEEKMLQDLWKEKQEGKQREAPAG